MSPGVYAGGFLRHEVQIGSTVDGATSRRDWDKLSLVVWSARLVIGVVRVFVPIAQIHRVAFGGGG